MESGHALLHEHLDELHQGCDEKNEHDGLQIVDSEGLQHAGVNHGGKNRRQEDDENNRAAHTGGGVGLLGDADEGAEAEETGKDDVIDQRAADQN